MAKRGITIICEQCGFAYVVQLPGEVPVTCDGCRAQTTWRTRDDPSVEYALTANDRRFLKAIRIAIDE